MMATFQGVFVFYFSRNFTNSLVSRIFFCLLLGLCPRIFCFLQRTYPKPKDDAGKKVMMTKELNNGRLAMLATIGVWAQELVDGKTILGHLFGG